MMVENLVAKIGEIGTDPDTMNESALATYYRDARLDFRIKARRMKTISKGTGGFLSLGHRMFWSSVLFTRLTVMAQSIVELAPSPQPKSHWDFSSLGSLVRNFAECYLVMRFMCAGSVDEDEREARVLMMHLHDNFSRHRMLTELGIGDTYKDEFATNKIDLEGRIRKTKYFVALAESKQRVILKGDRTPFVQDEIIEEIGMDRGLFRGLYRLLSSQTHSGPISFYRMSEHGTGCGVENSVEKTYMAFALNVASDFAERACVDLLTIFPNAETRGSQVSERNIGGHLRKMREALSRGEIIDP